MNPSTIIEMWTAFEPCANPQSQHVVNYPVVNVNGHVSTNTVSFDNDTHNVTTVCGNNHYHTSN